MELCSEFCECIVLCHFGLRQDLSLDVFEDIARDSYDCRFDLRELGLSFVCKIGQVLCEAVLLGFALDDSIE